MITVNRYINGGWSSVSSNQTITVSQPIYSQDTILFLYDYSVGDEEGFQVSFSFSFEVIPNKIFKATELSDNEVVDKVITVANSGTKMVPLSLPVSSTEVTIEISLINGLSSPGNLTVWLL